MTLRIPLTPDQTLQTEFHEIERRLRKLEKSTGVQSGRTLIQVTNEGGSTNLQSIYERLAVIESTLASSIVSVDDIQDLGAVGPNAHKGLAPDPGQGVPPTGVAQHVLTENAEWEFPFRGLIGVATPGDETEAGDSVFVLGSMSVIGNMAVNALSCESVTLDADDITDEMVIALRIFGG